MDHNKLVQPETATTSGKTPEQLAAHLAAIVESSDDVIISKTLDGVITSWNNAAERIFGYTADEVIGKPITILIPEDRLTEEPSILERIRNGERVDHFETKRITKDRKLLDISLTISPIRDRNGVIIGVSKIARDITLQRRTERLIREGEERLRMAIDSTGLGTWEYYPLTGRLFWSDECKKIYDLPPDQEVNFELFSKHIYPEDTVRAADAIAKALDPSGTGDYDVEYRILRYSDKQLRWIRAQGKAYFSSQRPEIFIGTVLDITEQKLKEQKLKDSIELFTSMADNVPVMIWMSGNNKFQDYFNQTWLAFTGRTVEQEKNEGWIENVHPEDREKCVQDYRQASGEKKGFYTEYRLRRYDGQYRWVSDNSVVRYDEDGRFAGFISACIDIDDQKTLEYRKDDFIRMASHELKTPITSIKGYVQLLLHIYNDAGEQLKAAQPTIKSSLTTISKQVSKLTRLVSELLDLSRIETGKLEINKTKFDLQALVNETVQDIRLTTNSHAIITDSDFRGMIYGDRDRIGQVLVNFLTNALKYSPGSDRVDVTVKGDGKQVTVSVRDYGIGIDKKDHQRIFERFYRVEGKSEQTFPGFGIGLFIANEIVRQHNGYITVESEKGKGSLFSFTLPLELETGR